MCQEGKILKHFSEGGKEHYYFDIAINEFLVFFTKEISPLLNAIEKLFSKQSYRTS